MGRIFSQPLSLMYWLPLLIGMQSVPHTGAIRSAALVAGIVHLGWVWRMKRCIATIPAGFIEHRLFWLLTAWIVGQAALIAPLPLATTIPEVIGNWGKLILMAAMGIWLVRIMPSRQWINLAVFSGLYLHVIATILYEVPLLLNGYGLVFRESLFSNGHLASSFTIGAVALLFADGLARIWRLSPLFPWRPIVTAFLIGIAVVVELLHRVKAGQAMMAVLIVITAFAILACPHIGRKWKAALLVTILAILAAVAVTGGGMWGKAKESIKIAWAEPFSPEALAGDRAPVPAGTDHSFYLRAVRARVGLEGVTEYPLGMGFDTGVYRHYVLDHYDLKEASNSSNSGMIDFALATGIPGLASLLIFLIALMWRGWQGFLAGRSEGIALTFLILQHFGRYLLDGTLAGSRLTGFALVAGIFWALVAIPRTNADE